MKAAYLILIAIHGLIHVLGFVKAFSLAEVSQLTTPISRPIGLLWILAAMILLAFGILFLLDSEYGWIVGAVAIVLSQALILMYWGEAKFGTIPNVIIFVVVLVSYSQFTLPIGCNWY